MSDDAHDPLVRKIHADLEQGQHRHGGDDQGQQPVILRDDHVVDDLLQKERRDHGDPRRGEHQASDENERMPVGPHVPEHATELTYVKFPLDLFVLKIRITLCHAQALPSAIRSARASKLTLPSWVC